MTDSTPDLTADLELALAVADAADAYTLPHFVDRDFSVDLAGDMMDIGVFKTANNLNDRVDFPDMAQKLVAETFAL